MTRQTIHEVKAAGPWRQNAVHRHVGEDDFPAAGAEGSAGSEETVSRTADGRLAAEAGDDLAAEDGDALGGDADLDVFFGEGAGDAVARVGVDGRRRRHRRRHDAQFLREEVALELDARPRARIFRQLGFVKSMCMAPGRGSAKRNWGMGRCQAGGAVSVCIPRRRLA